MRAIYTAAKNACQAHARNASLPTVRLLPV